MRKIRRKYKKSQKKNTKLKNILSKKELVANDTTQRILPSNPSSIIGTINKDSMPESIGSSASLDFRMITRVKRRSIKLDSELVNYSKSQKKLFDIRTSKNQ